MSSHCLAVHLGRMMNDIVLRDDGVLPLHCADDIDNDWLLGLRDVALKAVAK